MPRESYMLFRGNFFGVFSIGGKRIAAAPISRHREGRKARGDPSQPPNNIGGYYVN